MCGASKLSRRAPPQVFDRRILHCAPVNHSAARRVAWFIGYSYRWLRARDEMTVGALLPHAGPIRRQLLTAGPTGGSELPLPIGSARSPSANGRACGVNA